MPKSAKQAAMDDILKGNVGSLTDHELFDFIISYSQKDKSAEIIDILMNNFIGIRSIVDSDPRILINKFKISENSAILLKMINALSQQSSIGKNKISSFSTSESAKEFFRKHFVGTSAEHFTAVAVDDDFRKTDIFRSALGSSLSVQTSSSDIIRFAAQSNCSRLFIAHNHLNENTSPSESDIISTKKLIAMLEMHGITIIDHIIAGRNSSESMRENPSLDLFDNVPDFGYKFNKKS